MGDIFSTGHFTKIDLEKNVTEYTKGNYNYIASFKESADTLLEIAMQSENVEEGYIDGKIYPIVYLYRQYLELLLLNIIGNIDDEYNGSPYNLEQMWEHIENVFKREKLMDVIGLARNKEIINEFQKIEPKSSDYRCFYEGVNMEAINLTYLKSSIQYVTNALFFTYRTVI